MNVLWAKGFDAHINFEIKILLLII